MDHRVEIRQGWESETPKPHRMYEPACSCGWVGRAVDSMVAAETDGDEHVLMMSRAEPL